MNPEEYLMKYNEPVLSCERFSDETLRILNDMLAPKISINMIELDGHYEANLQLNHFEIVLLSFEKM